MSKKESLFDLYLLVPIFCLTLISIVFIFSSSNVLAYDNYQDPFFFLKRQIIALSISIIIFSIFIFIPLSFYRENGALMIIVTFCLLILVLIPWIGKEVNGSRRWLDLGFFNLQPSEIAKVFITLYLCGYCLRRKEQLETSWWGFLKPLAIVGICCCLLLLEPDLGATVVLFMIGLSILFVGGAKTSQLVTLGFIFLIIILIFVYFDEVRATRVLSFSDPFDDPQNTDYQLLNALIASVQGGIFGMGIGESTQKYFFLPEAHTDFIFSIYVEETGITGMTVLFLLYFTIFFRLAHLTSTSFKRGYLLNSLFLLSFALIFFFQTILNVFVNLGLLPTKGLALPFVSYGGSSAIMNFLILSITLRASWEFRNNIK